MAYMFKSKVLYCPHVEGNIENKMISFLTDIRSVNFEIDYLI